MSDNDDREQFGTWPELSHNDDDTQPFGQYQGWTNWDTWNANLWLTNDAAIYNAAMIQQSPESLRTLFEETFSTSRDREAETPFIDGIDPAKVNWQEIYNSLHEGE